MDTVFFSQQQQLHRSHSNVHYSDAHNYLKIHYQLQLITPSLRNSKYQHIDAIFLPKSLEVLSNTSYFFSSLHKDVPIREGHRSYRRILHWLRSYRLLLSVEECQQRLETQWWSSSPWWASEVRTLQVYKGCVEATSYQEKHAYPQGCLDSCMVERGVQVLPIVFGSWLLALVTGWLEGSESGKDWNIGHWVMKMIWLGYRILSDTSNDFLLNFALSSLEVREQLESWMIFSLIFALIFLFGLEGTRVNVYNIGGAKTLVYAWLFGFGPWKSKVSKKLCVTLHLTS